MCDTEDVKQNPINETTNFQPVLFSLLCVVQQVLKDDILLKKASAQWRSETSAREGCARYD